MRALCRDSIALAGAFLLVAAAPARAQSPGDLAAVKQAILQIVADLYANRGDEADIVSSAAQALLAPYRIFRL